MVLEKSEEVEVLERGGVGPISEMRTPDLYET